MEFQFRIRTRQVSPRTALADNARADKVRKGPPISTAAVATNARASVTKARHSSRTMTNDADVIFDTFETGRYDTEEASASRPANNAGRALALIGFGHTTSTDHARPRCSGTVNCALDRSRFGLSPLTKHPDVVDERVVL
jgi:hypothetical protein